VKLKPEKNSGLNAALLIKTATAAKNG